MWSSTSGNLVDRFTQRWVEFTGRDVDFQTQSWLRGPTGQPEGIGKDYFQKLAERNSLQLHRPPVAGLLQDFALLRSPSFDPGKVAAEVIDFYQATSTYALDAWSEWCGLFRPFGVLLAMIFSRRLQQLNLPLSSLDTSRGITSEILQLRDPASGEVRCTAWLRELLSTGNVLYAGVYTTCQLPGFEGLCIKVVFPLPNGNAMVIMRPEAHSDGSFSVISHGDRFGEPGFYFTVHSSRGVRARYLKSLRESIRVYPDEANTVRADHMLSIWGARFLRLHYRLIKRKVLEASN